VTLVFCSNGYFDSPNCMRELLRATVTEKQIVAMLEPEAAKGGLSLTEIENSLLRADSPTLRDGTQYASCYEMWGLDAEVASWGYHMPSAKVLMAALFAREPIEWNRIGFFQDVTLRLIANSVLPADYGETYVQGELISKKPSPLMPPKKHVYHVYCSPFNPGGEALLAELAAMRDITLAFTRHEGVRGASLEVEDSAAGESPLQRGAPQNWKLVRNASAAVFQTGQALKDASDMTVQGLQDASDMTVQGLQDATDMTVQGLQDAADMTVQGLQDAADMTVQGLQDAADMTRQVTRQVPRQATKDVPNKRSRMRRSRKSKEKSRDVLLATDRAASMVKCQHFLVYLTGVTWKRKASSKQFGLEVMKAMDLGVHLLLVHEMPGVGGQAERHGCDFGTFFSDTVPNELLQRGIYSQIAIALKGGEWRKASMAMLSSVLGMRGEDVQEAASAGGDLGFSLEELSSRVDKQFKVDWKGLLHKSATGLGDFANETSRLSSALCNARADGFVAHDEESVTRTADDDDDVEAVHQLCNEVEHYKSLSPPHSPPPADDRVEFESAASTSAQLRRASTSPQLRWLSQNEAPPAEMSAPASASFWL